MQAVTGTEKEIMPRLLYPLLQLSQPPCCANCILTNNQYQ
jgi:hypothetical protein